MQYLKFLRALLANRDTLAAIWSAALVVKARWVETQTALSAGNFAAAIDEARVLIQAVAELLKVGGPLVSEWLEAEPSEQPRILRRVAPMRADRTEEELDLEEQVVVAIQSTSTALSAQAITGYQIAELFEVLKLVISWLALLKG